MLLALGGMSGLQILSINTIFLKKSEDNYFSFIDSSKFFDCVVHGSGRAIESDPAPLPLWAWLKGLQAGKHGNHWMAVLSTRKPPIGLGHLPIILGSWAAQIQTAAYIYMEFIKTIGCAIFEHVSENLYSKQATVGTEFGKKIGYWKIVGVV